MVATSASQTTVSLHFLIFFPPSLPPSLYSSSSIGYATPGGVAEAHLQPDGPRSYALSLSLSSKISAFSSSRGSLPWPSRICWYKGLIEGLKVLGLKVLKSLNPRPPVVQDGRRRMHPPYPLHGLPQTSSISVKL